MESQEKAPPHRSEEETAGLPPREKPNSGASVADTLRVCQVPHDHYGWDVVPDDDGQPYTIAGHVLFYHRSRQIYAIERDAGILRPLLPQEWALAAISMSQHGRSLDVGDFFVPNDVFADRCARERDRAAEVNNPGLAYTELWREGGGAR